MLNKLWKKRLNEQHKRFLKYARYIFNDHFTLVLLVALGGASLVYAQALRSLTHLDFWQWSLVSALLVALSFLGRLATFIQKADAYFLGLLEIEWDLYLKRARNYSFLVPFGAISLLQVVLLPLYQKAGIFFVYPWVMTLLFKWGHLTFLMDGLKYHSSLPHYRVLHLVLMAVASYCLYSGLAWLALVLAFGFVGVTTWLSQKNTAFWNWEKLVDQEAKRVQSLLRFVRLFVDVPLIESKVYPRAYFDIFYRSKDSTFLFLIKRLFFRGRSYLYLSVQLTFMAILMVLVFNLSDFLLMVSLLLMALTGLQLLPLYAEGKQLFWSWLPLANSDKKKDFKQFMGLILGSQTLLLHLFSLILGLHFSFVVSLLASLGMIYIVFPLYVERKIDKM